MEQVINLNLLRTGHHMFEMEHPGLRLDRTRLYKEVAWSGRANPHNIIFVSVPFSQFANMVMWELHLIKQEENTQVCFTDVLAGIWTQATNGWVKMWVMPPKCTMAWSDNVYRSLPMSQDPDSKRTSRSATWTCELEACLWRHGNRCEVWRLWITHEKASAMEEVLKNWLDKVAWPVEVVRHHPWPCQDGQVGYLYVMAFAPEIVTVYEPKSTLTKETHSYQSQSSYWDLWIFFISHQE